MNRFDIALNKKKPVEKTINKVKGSLLSNIVNRFQNKSDGSSNTQIPPIGLERQIERNPGNWDSPDNSNQTRMLQGQTGTQIIPGVTHMFGVTGTQGVRGQPGLTISSQGQLGIDISSPEQEESALGEQIHREMAVQAEEVARTMLNMGTSAITHSGDTMSSRGPTSRHLLIAGPDGHRIIIPLRSLAYSISENENGRSTLHLTLPTREAQALNRDIRAGFQRQGEVDGGRYG